MNISSSGKCAYLDNAEECLMPKENWWKCSWLNAFDCKQNVSKSVNNSCSDECVELPYFIWLTEIDDDYSSDGILVSLVLFFLLCLCSPERQRRQKKCNIF